MTSSPLQPALLALALALGAGATWIGLTAARDPVLAGCSRDANIMQRIELVFGLSRKGRPDISEAEWRLFLDREVTPRFPDGLTVLAGDGQWRNAAGVAVKEPARLLLVWTKPATDLGSRVEAIRTAWKLAHAQESVLHATATNCVGF